MLSTTQIFHNFMKLIMKQIKFLVYILES